MAHLFYDHLIIIEEIVMVLDAHHVSNTEKEKLLSVIDQTLHHHILDAILTHLPKTSHEEFLTKLLQHPYDPGMIVYLNEKTGKNMEKEILAVVAKVKGDIAKEIQKAAIGG